ncbi:3824_t:CDS:2, partial [Acaulospora colombiana]
MSEREELSEACGLDAAGESRNAPQYFLPLATNRRAIELVEEGVLEDAAGDVEVIVAAWVEPEAMTAMKPRTVTMRGYFMLGD